MPTNNHDVRENPARLVTEAIAAQEMVEAHIAGRPFTRFESGAQ
jgi:hypothetical protein